MTISTYVELQNSISDWLHRGDLSTISADLIMIGEKRIFREVRCIEMESTLSLTTASGVAALPSDYLDLKLAYVTGTPYTKLNRSTPSQIYEQYPLRSGSGTPKLIAREGQNFVFGPYPTDGLTIAGTYYAEPTSVATTPNTLFLAHPDLYLYAALLAAAPYLKNDSRVNVWENEYLKIKDQIDSKTVKEERSGGGLAVRVA